MFAIVDVCTDVGTADRTLDLYKHQKRLCTERGRKSLARLGNQIPVSGAPVLHWICTNIKRDCVLKVECGRKSRATLGNEIPVSVALVFSSDGLYQLSCPASGPNDGWLVFRE